MTRINLVSPSTLCDQHLLAEFRELPRIPNALLRKSVEDLCDLNIPSEYCLGTGHVTFFYNKLMFLTLRYTDLYKECLFRGFNVIGIIPPVPKEGVYRLFYDEWQPSPSDIELNIQRINDRMPVNVRRTNRVKPDWAIR